MLKIAIISICIVTAIWLIAIIYIVTNFKPPEDPYGSE